MNRHDELMVIGFMVALMLLSVGMSILVKVLEVVLMAM